jgi:hypothetical protein
MRFWSFVKFGVLVLTVGGLSGCGIDQIFGDAPPTPNEIFASTRTEILAQCITKRDSGALSYVTAAACSNDLTLKAFHSFDYWYIDLVARLNSQRLLLAEKVDKKEISPTQYQSELLQDWSAAIREESLRIAPFGKKSGHPALMGQAELFV